MASNDPRPLKRALTAAERQLAVSVFGNAIDLDRVYINRRKWWPLQPRNYCMAPDGELWVHPNGPLAHICFARASLADQGLFIHELTHVWQSQRAGRWFLPLMRHPFCRYDYRLTPGKPFHRYGIEQQAEIVRHAFLLLRGVALADRPDLQTYERLLPFHREQV